MARSWRLDEIREAVLERADVKSGSSFIPTSAEVNRYIDRSRARWHQILVRKGIGHADTRVDVTTQQGVDEYPLPDDFDIPIAIQIRASDGRLSDPLPELDSWESARVSRGAAWDNGTAACGYRILGQNDQTRLVLYPPGLPSGIVYRVSYSTVPERLTEDHQLVDDIAGGIEYIIADAARKVGRKERADTSGLERDIAAELDQVNQMAANRRLHATRRVIDVTGEAGEAGWPWDRRKPWGSDW